MNNQTYKFKVGEFECIAVSDGTLTYAPPLFPPPASLLFANAPQESLEQELLKHDMHIEGLTEWVSPYICLIINTGRQLVLVDTGADGLGPDTGKLLQNLRSQGIKPEDISTVILTHGHPDHLGGNTDSEGKLVFQNAQFIMWKSEWDFWNSEEEVLKIEEHSRSVLVGFARKNLPPIKSKLRLIDGEMEILPGIQAISTPGHTPGHITLMISSRDEKLLCLSDLALHPIHIEKPEWFAVVDFNPEQSQASRRRIFAKAADEKALVIAFHFPFPGLGQIIRTKEGWHWKSIRPTS